MRRKANTIKQQSGGKIKQHKSTSGRGRIRTVSDEAIERLKDRGASDELLRAARGQS
jgi:hypothetical protein